MGNVALITGITGQDGSYLAEYLLSHDYDVHGVMRRSSAPNTWRIDHLAGKITLHQSDLLDQSSLTRLVSELQPAEIYNLAAQSFVPASWDHPIATSEITALGVTRMLEAIRVGCPSAKFYQASSSEMFGHVLETPQTEKTPFRPRSPYGISKLYGHWVAINYRESYGMFTVSGILFNHESPRRGLEFVTRKITHGAARIKTDIDAGIEPQKLKLGNLAAVRDWGFAGDYVRAMWMMMQQSSPKDFVIATGEAHSVEYLVETAFKHARLNWQDHVETDKSLLRPAEVHQLLGDATKARDELHWEPAVNFEGLVKMMVDADLHHTQDGS